MAFKADLHGKGIRDSAPQPA